MQKFTEDQKKKALELAKTMPIKEAAKQSGCSLASLANWKREQKEAPISITKSVDISANLSLMKLLIGQMNTTCQTLIDAINRKV